MSAAQGGHRPNDGVIDMIAVERRCQGESIALSTPELDHAINLLDTRGLTLSEITRRLGVSGARVNTALDRMIGVDVSTSEPTLNTEPGRTYRPAATVAPGIEGILAAAERSPSKRLVNAAARLRQQLDALAEGVRAEQDAHKEKARAEVAELERRLAEAKARLEGNLPPAATVTRLPSTSTHRGPGRGEFPCPDCDKVSPTAQGLSAHRRFNHSEAS